jgi:membrane protein involved in D-alanine export
MIPYATFSYFGVLLYVVVPAVFLGMIFGRMRLWILVATLLMIVVEYSRMLVDWPGDNAPRVESYIAPLDIGLGREFWLLCAYGLFQLVVASTFIQIRQRTGNRWVFYGAIALGLLPLVLAKIQPYLAPGSVWGFAGLSYVTLRALDVIFGIQDGTIKLVPPLQLIAFLFFFPTISAGPIDRFRRFVGDWERRRTRAETLEDLDGAVHRIFTGFLYKFILAALIKQYWLDPVADDHGFLATVSYMYAYSLYLFFDFAGYSLFAIGISYLFGIRVPENFNRPFLATNIQDFWNRWHITLSTWLRDRVYRRFALTALRGQWFKDDRTASYIGFFLSFGLMGLWHGTQSFYLLYGLYHAALMAGYEAFSYWNRDRRLWGDGPLWRLAAIVITFHVVCFGFLLFSGRIGPTHA